MVRKRIKKKKPPSQRTVSRVQLASARAEVFARDDHRCIACGNPDTLQLAHVYSRRYIVIRHDPLNLMTLCAACHYSWHDRPMDWSQWFAARFPERVTYLQQQMQRAYRWPFQSTDPDSASPPASDRS